MSPIRNLHSVNFWKIKYFYSWRKKIPPPLQPTEMYIKTLHLMFYEYRIEQLRENGPESPVL